MAALARAHNSTGQLKEARKILIDILSNHPNHENTQLFLNEIDVRSQNLHNLNNPAPKYNEHELIYSKACRGILKQDESIVSKLKCHYEMKSPFSQIAPFKVEEANLDPYILVFHDVVFDSEIAVFRELSKPKVLLYFLICQKS